MQISTAGMGGSRAHEDAGGAVFDFADMQALREEYEERLRRLEREKDAALDVVRKDAGQRMTALRAEQDARLAAEGHEDAHTESACICRAAQDLRARVRDRWPCG